MGFIQFETTQNKKELKEGSLMSAPNDNWTIIFTSKHQSEFKGLKSKIDERRNNKSSSVIENTNPSSLNEIEKLAELRKKDIITEDEFQAKKKQLLVI